MEVKLCQIAYIYKVFLENDGSKKCAKVLEELDETPCVAAETCWSNFFYNERREKLHLGRHEKIREVSKGQYIIT